MPAKLLETLHFNFDAFGDDPSPAIGISMATATEEEFELSDGKKLYVKKWNPAGEAEAKLVFVHGYSDHCNRYYELFPTLSSRGIAVIGFDQRGWGQSAKKPSERGNAGPTSKILADLVEVIKAQLPSAIPIFVMGHSMGGGIALALASTPLYEELMPDIRGWLLESPYIALPKAAEPNALTVFMGRLAGKLLPHMRITHKIPPKNLTRDPAVMKSIEEDKLCFNIGTLETLSGMLDRADELEHGKYKLNKGMRALWISHGTADHATSSPASEKYCKAQTSVEDRTFKSYDGWSHQLHADLPDTRSVFAKDVGDWILARSEVADGKPAEQAKL